MHTRFNGSRKPVGSRNSVFIIRKMHGRIQVGEFCHNNAEKLADHRSDSTAAVVVVVVHTKLSSEGGGKRARQVSKKNIKTMKYALNHAFKCMDI